MVRFVCVVLVSVPSLAGPAVAQSDPPLSVTDGVTLASQYSFRGISLSDEQAAPSSPR